MLLVLEMLVLVQGLNGASCVVVVCRPRPTASRMLCIRHLGGEVELVLAHLLGGGGSGGVEHDAQADERAAAAR